MNVNNKLLTQFPNSDQQSAIERYVSNKKAETAFQTVRLTNRTTNNGASVVPKTDDHSDLSSMIKYQSSLVRRCETSSEDVSGIRNSHVNLDSYRTPFSNDEQFRFKILESTNPRFTSSANVASSNCYSSSSIKTSDGEFLKPKSIHGSTSTFVQPDRLQGVKHGYVTPDNGKLNLRTPRASTSSSDRTSHMIVAVTEGRGLARGEVGIAAMDIKRPYLILCQISDTQTYVNTLRKINVLNPSEILIPNTFMDNTNSNKLFQLLNDQFPNASLKTVQRKVFHDSQGLQQIQNICLPEYSNVQLLILKKFYALSASAAVLKYVEFVQHIIFTPKTVRVEYQGMEDVTFIDIESAQRLELVQCQNLNTIGQDYSLYGVLNKCSTLGGQRRLRACILQPSCNETEITNRLNCVAEILRKSELFVPLKKIMPKFLDVEQLLWLCTQVTNYKDNQKSAEVMINYALLLKSTLDVLPSLKEELKDTESEFFRNFQIVLSDERYELMSKEIKDVLHEDSRTAKGYALSQFQRCFAIKPNVNGLLDVARSSYSELVGDFNAVVKDLAKEYGLPLIVKALGSKGMVIQFSLKNLNKFDIKDLPSIFIQVEKSKSTVTMTTKDLLFMKQRINQAVNEIQIISSIVVYEMLQNLREHIGCLNKLCEYIADLDLILSFAELASIMNYVRPTFLNFTNVQSSRHPILDFISPSRPVENDICASIDNNFQIITGANMSGKSTYIRQVVLIQIMAQMGCYVPAASAQFRICDRIFTRISFNDNMECNASSFIVEVKEMQYIMKNITKKSLIVIDELFRGTSTEEGASLAWAVSEQILTSQAFIFFTTHFLYLSKLKDMYYNVSNFHMQAMPAGEDGESLSQLIYTHKLVQGALKLENYGLRLAQVTGFPKCVLKSSLDIARQINHRWKAMPVQKVDQSNDDDDVVQLNNAVIKLLNLMDTNELTVETANQVQKELRLKYRKVENETNKGNMEKCDDRKKGNAWEDLDYEMDIGKEVESDKEIEDKTDGEDNEITDCDDEAGKDTGIDSNTEDETDKDTGKESDTDDESTSVDYKRGNKNFFDIEGSRKDSDSEDESRSIDYERENKNYLDMECNDYGSPERNDVTQLKLVNYSISEDDESQNAIGDNSVANSNLKNNSQSL